MKLATVRTTDGTRAARVEGDRLLLLPPADIGAVLAAGGSATISSTAAALEPLDELSLMQASFAPVVMRPEKIFCVGSNYKAHIAEMSHEVPKYPTLFAKFASSLLGANDELVLPKVSSAVDWEVELGVVIGQHVWRATPAEALEAIAGFTVVNDVSMRDWQNRTSQFLQGKTFDASTPVGPFLVTRDEIGDGGDLELRCEVDGVTMQCGRTSDLLFGPGEIVSYISQFATLRPGDIISTGTPAGVGAGRDPQVFLAPGQVLTSAIEGIGSCVNQCLAEVDSAS